MSPRQKIKKKLIKTAEQDILRFKKYKLLKKDKKMKYEVRYTSKNDLPVLVIKYNVKGFNE